MRQSATIENQFYCNKFLVVHLKLLECLRTPQNDFASDVSVLLLKYDFFAEKNHV